MSERVLLHVGTPKTGTSYLQDVLNRNTRTLAGAGISYPADRFDAHFLAALDLMRLPWGGLEAEAVGRWDRLAKEVRRHRGTSIVSHEILAAASRTEADRALESLGHGSGAEVHLIVSVRDLVRQIPAEWQENVKHRAGLSYGAFLDRIRDPDRGSRIASWFWSVQELPAILERWGHDLPPEQIHLVTVPPPGGAQHLLWSRFSTTFGLDGLELDLEAERVNPSLGVPETTLLRRINLAVNQDLPPADYRWSVREFLAHHTLSSRTGTPRLMLPPDMHPWVSELTASWVAEIELRGYDVVGDLTDLAGAPPVPDYVDPDHPDEPAVNEAAIEVIRALLLDAVKVRESRDRVQAELSETRGALERSYLRPTYRWRERTVRALQSSRVGRRLLSVYRRARGRSSRPA